MLCNRLKRSSKTFLFSDLEGRIVHVICKRLHHVGASPGVGYFRDARLLLDDDLGVAGDTGTLHRGQSQRLIKRVGVQRLRTPKHCSHGLNHCTDHVVVGVL